MQKKFLLPSLLVFSPFAFSDFNSFSNGDFFLRGGVNVYNQYSKIENVTEKKGDAGFELGVEYLINSANSGFSFGVGTMYQFNSKVDGHKSVDTEIWISPGTEQDTEIGYHDTRFYDSIPIYVTGKYQAPINNEWNWYLKGDLGFSFNTKKDDLVWSDRVKNEVNDVDVPISYKETIYSTKVKNGVYAGIGVGVAYKQLDVNLMYKYTSAKVEIDTLGEKSQPYSRLSLGFGYRF